MIRRHAPRLLVLAAAITAAFGIAAPAQAAGSVTPYIEAEQVLTADFNGAGEVITYSQVTAGIDATYTSRRTAVQLSYQYERRIPWDKNIAQESIHDGLAVGHLELVPGLSLDGGALATRARADIRGDAPALFAGDERNVSQAFAAFAGPTLATHAGELQIGAAYRLGYVHVDTPDDVVLGAGQPPLDRYSSALSHTATASLGMRPGPLPFGWTLSGGWTRESSGRLSQRYEGKFGRLDLLVPLSPTLALVGGVGYEDIKLSQRTPVIGTDGFPVLDSKGRFIADETQPRLIAYDDDGLIWDAGVSWRPTHRTSLEARVGHRYGGTIYTGTLDHQFSDTARLQVGVYEGIESFGRALTGDLARVPAQFEVPSRGLGNPFGRCIYGTTGGGQCLSNALQSANTSNFHSRGAYGLVSGQGGQWNFGFSASYDEREYIAPRLDGTFDLDGIKDRSVTLSADASRPVSARGTFSAQVYSAWYRSGIDDAPEVMSLGAVASYYHNFDRHLLGLISAGVFAGDRDGFGSDYSGSLLVGLRYEF